MNHTKRTNFSQPVNSTRVLWALASETLDLNVTLPVFFAVKMCLDCMGALSSACLLAVCRRKRQIDPNAVSLIIIHLVSCWLFMDVIVITPNDIITFLYMFGYRVSTEHISIPWTLSWYEHSICKRRLINQVSRTSALEAASFEPFRVQILINDRVTWSTWPVVERWQL